MLVVGLTGGIATGKSTVSQEFKRLKIPVVDADEISRQIVEPGQACYKEIVAKFGVEILDIDSRINRAKLGEVIFQDQDKRKTLNRITHPRVRLHIIKQVLRHYLEGHDMVVLDIPLLFESGLDKFVNLSLVVWCTVDQQLERLMTRNQLTKRQAQSRINSQMGIQEKIRLSSFAIDNSGERQQTKLQVERFVAANKSSLQKVYLVFWGIGLIGYIIMKVLT
jgi:dephospho-CoA kinase